MDNKDECLLKECYHICKNKYKVGDSDCILYCEKSDWYEVTNGKKDWSKSVDKIEKFWDLFYELKHYKNKIVYKDLIFPKFLGNLNLSEKNKKYLLIEKIVEFRNCIFEDNFILENTVFINRVSFAGSIFNGNIILTKSMFTDIVDFTRARFEGEVFLESTTFIGSIYLNYVIIKNKFILVLNKLYIEEYKSLFNNLNKKIKSVSLRHLHLENTILDKESYVEFRGFYEASKKEIYNMKLITLSISNILNYSKSFKLNNMEIDFSLNITNSNLGVTEFNNINLKNLKYEVQFRDSSLVDTKFNNIKWCEEKKIKGDREDFRQLKNILDNQKNFIDANLMHKKELDFYQREIKEDDNFQKQATNFILVLSKMFSNHGTCWILPIGWFLYVSIVSFFIFYFSSSLIEELNSFSDLLNYFARYINPLNHKIFEKFGNMYWWWFLHKIFAIFITYHLTISLKRKVRR